MNWESLGNFAYKVATIVICILSFITDRPCYQPLFTHEETKAQRGMDFPRITPASEQRGWN